MQISKAILLAMTLALLSGCVGQTQTETVSQPVATESESVQTPSTSETEMTALSHDMQTLGGETVSLSKYQGNVVLMVNDFATTLEWYQRRFGLLVSDEIVMHQDGQEQTLGAFTRCNRGADFVDHHTLLLHFD